MGSEFLKRDDQFLAYRSQNEEARSRMVREARDKDRALAQSSRVGEDGVAEMADDTAAEEAAVAMGSQEAFGSKLIVIHVGSQNLRIGLGTDALPKTVPMVIARKWQKNESEEDGGEPKPKRFKIDGEVPDEPEKWFGEDVGSMQAFLNEERAN